MIRRLLLAFLIFSGQQLLAQKISIRGQLMDTTSVGLPSATILLLSPKDSTLLNFASSDTNGRFEMRNLNRQDYLLKVTFVGYAPLTRIVQPSVESLVDLGLLKMNPQSKLLGEVVVETERAPVVIKNDTIEFNADSFKSVKENAVVEDLLKRLPGVEVDADGTVRAQGEQVKRFTVDGKNFFGSDPKLATRNLPADAVDKVQVFEKKSDQAAFSGIDDGQREKTINLTLKEEKKKGAFGNVQAGLGTSDRYQARATINRFRKGQQLSFLGMANNTNEQGFSIDDYLSFTGGGQQMMSGRGQVRVQVNSDNQNGVPLNFGGRNSGFMSNYAGGLNFNNAFNAKTELNTSYFYNHLNHSLDQATERINYFPAGDLTFNQNSRQENTNDNHRVNAVLDHKIDSLNSLKLSTSLTYSQTDTREYSTSENRDAEGVLENESIRNTTSSGTSVNLSANLLWRHRFGKKGRTLSVNTALGYSDSDRDGTQDATNTFYGEDQEITNLLQANDQATTNISYEAGFSYTEPLGGRKYLEANYSFRQNLNDVDRQVFDLNIGEPTFNPVLSNQYKSDYQYHRGGLNFRMNRTKYNITAGSSIQQTFLDGELILLNSTIKKSYQNVLPAAHFNYEFSSSKHLRFDYETSIQEPTIQQLQPVVDNSDPLNLSVGNPDLRPAYVQNWRVNFTTFDPVRFMSFFSFIEATHTNNAITTSQSYTEQNIRISKPVNVDNNVRVTGNATFSFPVSKIGSRFGITATATRQEGANILNDVESNIAQNTIGGTLRYSYRYKEFIDVNLSANISRQSTKYEFDTQTDQLFFNKTYTAQTNVSFLKNYTFSADFEYLVYDSKTTDYNQVIPLLNLSVSRYLLKAKSGELKFSVNNLLDRSIGVSQQADINYFERKVANSLGRYYMVTFVYAINKHLNPMGMRRGPMIRITR